MRNRSVPRWSVRQGLAATYCGRGKERHTTTRCERNCVIAFISYKVSPSHPNPPGTWPVLVSSVLVGLEVIRVWMVGWEDGPMPQTGASEISAVKATPISPGGVKCVWGCVVCVTECGVWLSVVCDWVWCVISLLLLSLAEEESGGRV